MKNTKLDPHVTPVDLLLRILENAKVDAENIKFLRFGSTPAEKDLIYYTDENGHEHATFVRQNDRKNFLFAKELAMDSNNGSDKKFGFFSEKNQISIKISGNENYSVCHKKHYGQESILISTQPESALFFAEEFLNEIRAKEHEITSKAETGDKFSSYADSLLLFSRELEKVVSVLKNFFLPEQNTQPSSE